MLLKLCWPICIMYLHIYFCLFTHMMCKGAIGQNWEGDLLSVCMMAKGGAMNVSK